MISKLNHLADKLSMTPTQLKTLLVRLMRFLAGDEQINYMNGESVLSYVLVTLVVFLLLFVFI